MDTPWRRRPPRSRLAWALVAATLLPLGLHAFTTDPLVRPATPFEPDALLAAFQSPEPDRVRDALARLRLVRPPPVDWLVAMLRHEHRGVREWSAHALGDAAPQDPRAVRALMHAFEDPDDLVRWKAARALGRIGPLAAAAIPLLQPVADAAPEREQAVVRATAKRAIEQIRAGN